jgi:hypothetical protein
MEVAEHLSFDYPHQMDGRVVGYLRRVQALDADRHGRKAAAI